MKNFLLFVCLFVPGCQVTAEPIVNFGVAPDMALPGIPVKFEIVARPSDGNAASIENAVALLVTSPSGERFVANAPGEDRAVSFPGESLPRVGLPAHGSTDLSFCYNAPWTLDCRLHDPGEYRLQLIIGRDAPLVLSGDARGVILSNVARFRVLPPEGDDAKVYEAWRAMSGGCWMHPSSSLASMVWEKYPGSTYASYFVPAANNSADVNQQISLFRESLRRWPSSVVIESKRLGLARELVTLADQSVARHELSSALAAARESTAILTELSRRANDPMIRREAAEALENAYDEQDVLKEFSPEKRKVLIPFVECVAPTTNGMRAWFGVANQTGQAKSVPVGAKNKMTPAPQDRGQLTTFPEGIRHLAFSVDVDGPVIEWHLEGKSVQAMLDKSLRCPEDMDAEVAKLPRNE